MSGVVRASLLVGAAARLSLILELHTRTAPHFPKLAADLRNKVANVSGLNSTDIFVEKLPDEFFFPCPEILASDESGSEAAVVARQLRGEQAAQGERAFLGYQGRHGRHHDPMQSFPILLEVRGATGGKLINDLHAHASDLSATGCGAAGHPCKVTFALYDCRVQERHHRHGHHHIPPFAGAVMLISHLCCCLALMRVIRYCCCGDRRGWGCCRGRATAAQCPFLQSAGAAPVQARIVNGVILPHNAPSAGPAVLPTAPTATAPAVAADGQPAGLYPAGVYPAVPAAPTYVPMGQANADAELNRALALSEQTEENAQLNRALAVSLAEAQAAQPAEAAARYCPECGAPNPEAHRFCGACGQPLQPGATPAAGLQL